MREEEEEMEEEMGKVAGRWLLGKKGKKEREVAAVGRKGTDEMLPRVLCPFYGQVGFQKLQASPSFPYLQKWAYSQRC